MDLPKLIIPPDVAQLTAPPTYSDLFNETMGAAATDADGFAHRLLDLADRLGAFQTDVQSADGDLADLGLNVAGVDPEPVTAIAATLPDITAAGDKLANGFDALTLGQVSGPTGTGGAGTVGCTPGTVVEGLTIGQPDPNPYPRVAPTDRPVQFRSWPTMCTGDPPLDGEVIADTFTHDHSLWADAHLVGGDAAMFSLSTVARNDDGKAFVNELHLHVTPAQAGRFSAVIQIDSQDGETWGGNIYYQVSVTVVNKPK